MSFFTTLFLCCFLLFNAYIFCLLACMCCRIRALCTVWFEISPFSCGEPSPVLSNYNNEAQGPYFSLGLDTVQKGTFTRTNLTISEIRRQVFTTRNRFWRVSFGFPPLKSEKPEPTESFPASGKISRIRR